MCGGSYLINLRFRSDDGFGARQSLDRDQPRRHGGTEGNLFCWIIWEGYVLDFYFLKTPRCACRAESRGEKSAPPCLHASVVIHRSGIFLFVELRKNDRAGGGIEAEDGEFVDGGEGFGPEDFVGRARGGNGAVV